MKGLLHSKKFRTNLYKWLFMYVGVMLLFTTVITYSKYISSMDGNDEARPAKFIIKVEPLECANCNLTAYRPTSKIEQDFQINLEELEVTTDLELTITVDKDYFELVSFEPILGKNETPLLSSCAGSTSNNANEVKLCGRIPVESNKLLKYKAIVKYKNENELYKYVAKTDAQGNPMKYNIINVGYSGVQVTK